MPGQRRIDRDIGGFTVADLADQDHIRVLPHDVAQPGSEREPDLRIHLHLAQAGKLVFDRVFDRDDLAFAVVQLLHHAVKRGGLAGTGRTDHEEDAVRNRNQLLELSEQRFIHAELAQVELHRILAQQAHHDALAVHDRNRADADVDLAAADLEIRAPVLRQTAFSDVQSADQLDARRDRGVVRQRQTQVLMQHAVDAETDHQLRLLRLHMDVARIAFERLRQHFIHKPDDLRFPGQLPELVFVVAGKVPLLFLLRLLIDLRGHPLDQAAAGELESDFPAEKCVEFIRLTLPLVGRCGKQLKRFIVPVVRQKLLINKVFLADAVKPLRLPEVLFVERLHAQNSAVDRQQVVFADRAAFRQRPVGVGGGHALRQQLAVLRAAFLNGPFQFLYSMNHDSTSPLF